MSNEYIVYFLFLSIFYMYTFWTYIYTHTTHGDGFYGVLVYMYLQTNDGVAGLCILYSTSFHCNYGNCLHIITNTITGSKSYRDDLHNLILKFGTTRTVCDIIRHHYVFQYCWTINYFYFIFKEFRPKYVVFNTVWSFNPYGLK